MKKFSSYYLSDKFKHIEDKIFDCFFNKISLFRRNNSAGFTLIELIVVVGIIGVIATISIPQYNEFKEKAKISRAAQDIRTLETDISGYLVEYGVYPPDLGAVGQGGLTDPWGHPYQYVNPQTKVSGFGTFLNGDFDLYSMGADGATSLTLSALTPNEASDDVLRISDGTFVGLGSNYFE